MTQVDQQIKSLRTKFFQKLDSEGAPETDGFHPADIARVKNSDDWLRRFLGQTENDLNLALNMLWDTCDWRKKFGTNDINESNVKQEYLEAGTVFSHGQDIDGRSLLIFNCKKYVKGQIDIEEMKRIVVYWMERLQRQDKGKPISVFFDMMETGLSNMDMEFTKYIILLFKSYYPEFLNYIIIFEMPWILNAAFKIIKSWLPAKAVQRMKTCNRASLREVVPPENALRSWGGYDDYEFSFVPEQRPPLHERADENKKKVHFADGSPTTETFLNFNEGERSNGMTVSGLVITPADTINFCSDGSELTGMVTLTNTDEGIISYKVKTTSPEKFRVRPSTGTLEPSTSVSINIVLQPGYQTQGLSREKFLIMSLPVSSSDMSATELADLWKQAGGKSVSQHRLKCNIGVPGEQSTLNGTPFSSIPVESDHMKQILANVSHLHDSQAKLFAEVRFLKKLQFLTIIVICALAFIIHSQKPVDGHCYKP